MYVCILGSYVFKHSIVYIIHTQYLLEENFHLILSILSKSAQRWSLIDDTPTFGLFRVNWGQGVCWWRLVTEETISGDLWLPAPWPAQPAWPVELETNLREVWSFMITEKALTRTFSWLKGPTYAFTIKTLFRHYAKQAPKLNTASKRDCEIFANLRLKL